MVNLCRFVLLLLLLCGNASAGFEEGAAAERRGDYAAAAAQGYASSQLNLAYLYQTHRAIATNDADLLHWYRIAAERGDAVMQAEVGTMYLYGRGVPPDRSEAEQWFRRSAEQGDARASVISKSLESKGSGSAVGGANDALEQAAWSPELKDVAVSGCTYALLTNAELDYLARQNIHRERLPPGFRQRVEQILPISKVCLCSVEKISSEVSWKYFFEHQAEMSSKIQDPSCLEILSDALRTLAHPATPGR